MAFSEKDRGLDEFRPHVAGGMEIVEGCVELLRLHTRDATSQEVFDRCADVERVTFDVPREKLIVSPRGLLPESLLGGDECIEPEPMPVLLSRIQRQEAFLDPVFRRFGAGVEHFLEKGCRPEIRCNSPGLLEIREGFLPPLQKSECLGSVVVHLGCVRVEVEGFRQITYGFLERIRPRFLRIGEWIPGSQQPRRSGTPPRALSTNARLSCEDSMLTFISPP